MKACAPYVCLLLFASPLMLAARELPREPIDILGSRAAVVQGGCATASVSFPADGEFKLRAPSNGWASASALQFQVVLPADAPTNVQMLVFLKDWDFFWYQTEASEFLVPGATNRFDVDLSATSRQWRPTGHTGNWHYRVLAEPSLFGVRLFCDQSYTGRVELCNVSVSLGGSRAAPVIRQVRQTCRQVPRFGKFEINCRLPDRYLDPFDPDVVSLRATFVSPSGMTNTVDGFYTRDFYRKKMVSDEFALPQGLPYWQVRYAPREEGSYHFWLNVTDQYGEDEWGPGQFEAGPAQEPGFIRVSRSDPRYFDFEDGSPFFLIGHNVRSPFDVRVVHEFPWMQRWEEGASAYTRYFENMSAAGENLAEVWTAAWSLGLEWSPKWRGYHGIGQYNMMHAWDLDQVIDEAQRTGMYMNLVIHNHGKFSAFSDQEWAHNPFNVVNGGYLRNPEDYFSDARARASYRKLMRYMIARWGYSTRIFAWELWSELDLTGSKRLRAYKSPECEEWHQVMGAFIHETDPNNHMVSTHVCGDFRHQNTNLISLAEMSLCPVDAYHGSADPLHIVELMNETLEFNLPYGKPVQITEFGGSARGQDVKHLRESLHAALWAAACSEMPGTPMLWWWHLVEEEDLYPLYTAVSHFMEGEDKRGVAMQRCQIQMTRNGGQPALGAQVMKSPTKALGWLHLPSPQYGATDPEGPTIMDGVTVELPDMRSGAFTIEFWDTTTGRIISTEEASPEGGLLTFTVPAFARDIAFKVRK